jgi:glutathione synthase/RimK-type ligase-like ATP-grasp enzyme
MKLLIITGSNAKEEATYHFIEESKKLFESTLVAPLEKIRAEYNGKKTNVYFKNTDLSKYDACLPRLFPGDSLFAGIVLDALEKNGVYLPATAQSFNIANHKYYTVKVLAEAGINVPTSALSVTAEPALRMSKTVGYPLVVKLITGFGGKGVMLAKEENDFKPLMDTLKLFNEFISIQEFFKGHTSDTRCIVLGKEVIGIKRTSSNN